MTTANPGRDFEQALDSRYRDDEILGVHCRKHGHLVAMGLSDHNKCSGWWQTGVVDEKPVGFRCSCSCHDLATPSQPQDL